VNGANSNFIREDGVPIHTTGLMVMYSRIKRILFIELKESGVKELQSLTRELENENRSGLRIHIQNNGNTCTDLVTL